MQSSQVSGPQPDFIKGLFSAIAKDYDKANSVITLGLDRNWRKALVKWSEIKVGSKVLDCATGTGDLAFEFKKQVGANGHVIGTDFCEEMLAETIHKKQKLNLDVQFENADVTRLQYPDNTFDATSIAYGIRNVSDPKLALSEMARVTKPGGKVLILETGSQQNFIIKKFYNFYFEKLVPRLGGMVTGKQEAYRYLNQSSGKFPCRSQFLDLMDSTQQFQRVEYRSFLGGASFLYRGTLKTQ